MTPLINSFILSIIVQRAGSRAGRLNSAQLGARADTAATVDILASASRECLTRLATGRRPIRAAAAIIHFHPARSFRSPVGRNFKHSRGAGAIFLARESFLFLARRRLSDRRLSATPKPRVLTRASRASGRPLCGCGDGRGGSRGPTLTPKAWISVAAQIAGADPRRAFLIRAATGARLAANRADERVTSVCPLVTFERRPGQSSPWPLPMGERRPLIIRRPPAAGRRPPIVSAAAGV